MLYTRAQANMAAHDVSEGSKRVNDLAGEIARAKERGRDTSAREAMLSEMKATLERKRDRQRTIEAGLAIRELSMPSIGAELEGV